MDTVPRRAFIIAVGSELLTPFRTDTNSLYLTSKLNDLGIEVVGKAIVGDRRAELAAFIVEALPRADLLVLTGGLGPTEDDVTRLSVADALGLPLDEDPAIVEHIRERFARRDMEMPAVNRVQAQVLRGAVVLANPNGTAPGQWVEHGGKTVVLLPGPPREMRPMIDAVLAERIAPLVGGRAPVPARAEDRRPHGVGRRDRGAAGLLDLRVVEAAGVHEHPRGAGADRTPLRGARVERRGGRRRRSSARRAR